MTEIRPGDILLYSKNPGLVPELVLAGELLEDGKQDLEFYHVAIALNANQKIEADGGMVVSVTEIGPNDGALVFRPPISPEGILSGLAAVLKMKGQKYDWLLIFDLGLRFLTRGFIHLPVSWVLSSEKIRKICSTLAAVYLSAAGYYKFSFRPSPEDIYLLIRNYLVLK